MEKPPIGIIPERFWKKERVHDLAGAITRYIAAGLENEVCVEEWRKEYFKWITELGIREWNQGD